MGEPRGPMEKGITYMVRPAMQPLKRPRSLAFMVSGSCQLLVRPASEARLLQMKVRSSTRATSEGSDRARKHPGCISGFRRRKVPALINSLQSWSYSASEPSLQCTSAGWQRAVISSTQASRAAWVVGAAEWVDAVIMKQKIRRVRKNCQRPPGGKQVAIRVPSGEEAAPKKPLSVASDRLMAGLSHPEKF